MHFSGSQVLVFIVLYVSHHWQFVGVSWCCRNHYGQLLFCDVNIVLSFLDFIKGLYFFLGWLCNFKELFIPVWREIHRSKILPVTSWQLTNRTVSDISRRSRHSIVNLFFFPWIYNMIQIHADETSRPPDFVARSVAARPRALKLASLTFQLVRGRLVASLSIFNLLYYVIWW